MVALLLVIGALLIVAFAAMVRARDPHHEFMFDLVQLLDLEHRVGRVSRSSRSDRAA